MTNRVALVTGATSGIGYETARMLAEHGYRVYAAGRRVERLKPLADKGVIAVQMDLTDSASIEKPVARILQKERRVDLLVNNAGYGSYGPVEQVSIDEVRRQFEVNLFGLARLTQLILPAMRRVKRGRIVNTSSIAGRMVTYMGAWYHATKYALEAFSDALRMEMRPFGIDVVLIEPGAIATNWGAIAADHLQTVTRKSVYQNLGSSAAAGLRKLYSSRHLTQPSAIAKAIVHASTVRHPRSRYLLGFGAKPLVALHALLPTRAWDYLMVHARDL
ncbi:SDR family NAD(P)-dependent oxidoreductase [Bifidobacterium sp. W8113]|uniref:oxidoreductase n=1 Tax=Bifidobacterium choladohabitans TaxID=2750947 RepID=UPI0018DB87ED|nr:oxidoreductase [Bifidobacterium choladohabitans]MBI0090563.1 SDR family NAD(P)-dependent oxidoreductase [Bifidobacterium choladohabitans]